MMDGRDETFSMASFLYLRDGTTREDGELEGGGGGGLAAGNP